MARDTAEVRPDAIINSKRPSGASPNPARPDLGQGSPQMPEADIEHTTAGDTGRAPGEAITTPSRRGLSLRPMEHGSCKSATDHGANPPIWASQQALASPSSSDVRRHRGG
jgi:hypothetical protein